MTSGGLGPGLFTHQHAAAEPAARALATNLAAHLERHGQLAALSDCSRVSLDSGRVMITLEPSRHRLRRTITAASYLEGHEMAKVSLPATATEAELVTASRRLLAPLCERLDLLVESEPDEILTSVPPSREVEPPTPVIRAGRRAPADLVFLADWHGDHRTLSPESRLFVGIVLNARAKQRAARELLVREGFADLDARAEDLRVELWERFRETYDLAGRIDQRDGPDDVALILGGDIF